MIIDTIFIRSFGKLQNTSLDLGKGINIIRGDNESGKSTLCNFIKFIFYGLQGKGEEKLKYISWDTMKASGYIDVTEEGRTFRVDRESICVYGTDNKPKFSDKCTVTELSSNRMVFQGKVPGEVFFGVDESVYDSTAFVGQLSDSKVGGKDLAEAAQNILFSGSEDVNVQKALKKLDDARKILLYKNQNGGKIYDLENECNNLRERLEKAEDSSTALIVNEGTYRETKQKLDSSKERFEKVSSAMDLWNKYSIYKLMKKRQVTYGNMASAQKKEEEALSDKKHFGARVYEDRYIDSLKKIGYDLTNANNEYIQAKQSRDEASKKMRDMAEKVQIFNSLGSDPQNRAELVNGIKLKHKQSKTMSSVALVFIILFVLSLVASVAVYFLNIFNVLYTIIAAGVFLAAAVILILMRNNTNKQLKKMYRKFNCKNYSEFEEMMSAALKDETVITFITETLRSAEENLKDKSDKLNTLNRQAIDKLRSDGFETSDNTLESLESAVSECQNYKEQLRILNNNTNVEQRSLDNIDETLGQYKKDYLESIMKMDFDEEAMNNFDYENKNKEYKFLSVSIENLTTMLQNLEKDIAVLKATNEDPSRLAVELDSKLQKLEFYKQKYVAYVMAINAVNNASGRLRESVSPKIADSAGKYLSELSEGKYTSLFLDTDFAVAYSDGQYTRSADNLSAGTGDITYIALRLALIETLYKSAIPPLVFDESFSRTDDSRLHNALKLLEKLSEKELQTILFTCHNREERVMASVGKYTLAKLS